MKGNATDCHLLHRMIRRLKCLAIGLDASLSSFSTSRRCPRNRSPRSAFHLNGKIGFPGGKPNGTGVSTGKVFEKKGIPSEVFSFLVFTGITGKSLYHLLYHTSAMLLCKTTRFRSRKWRPPSCLSVQHAVGRLYGS